LIYLSNERFFLVTGVSETKRLKYEPGVKFRRSS
jgi:hypothetical protein